MNNPNFLNFLATDIERLSKINTSKSRRGNKTNGSVKKYKCGKCRRNANGSIKTIYNKNKMYFCCIGCFEKKNI